MAHYIKDLPLTPEVKALLHEAEDRAVKMLGGHALVNGPSLFIIGLAILVEEMRRQSNQCNTTPPP